VSATAGRPSAGTRKLTRKGDAVGTSSTGFCRVTVVAPDSRTDVALPEDIPLADIWPELLRLTGAAPDCTWSAATARCSTAACR